MNKTIKKRWASFREAGEYSGLSAETLRRYAADGKLTAHRAGSRLIKVDLDGKQSGVPSVDHAVWDGIHGLADRAARMASMGRRPWLRALTS